ncbi:AMP-binding protein [Nocardia alba]|uniref:Fatty-acyl-CoA synthase n=1 Tax=Nocardia alba TaxID=225051 RepID=A0A4R1F730_9NOCA|nr:AMP-binding protein [Nocardia alba]TCJ89793.1 fatty-acyl-CoA synthase [Nocardia alba]
MTSSTVQSANFTQLTTLTFLQRSAEVYPSKLAIVYGTRAYTYREFLVVVEELARAIRADIRQGDRVAFLAPNVPELLIAHYAVPLAGGVLVAVNSRLAPDEVATILRHSEATMLFIDAELSSSLGDARFLSPALDVVVEIADPEFGSPAGTTDYGYPSFDDYLERAAPDSEPLAWQIDDELATISINYTSGTTGAPKGVMYSHRGAYLNALGEMHHTALTSTSVFLWTLPMFHCNGWCMPWAVTAAGGTHICLRAVRSEAVWQAIDEFDVSHLCGSPTVCSTIANGPEAHPLDRPLRITTAGAPPTPTVLEQLDALRISVVHVYGLTEVYGPYTVCEYHEEWDLLSPEARTRKLARQGVAMVQADPVRVVDKDMADVPRDGVTLGEIVMRGNNVMTGYFKDPEATADAFAGGWFHSGDLGVMHEDGYIEVKDRAKDIVISGGENISTVEVENALSSHPAVLDVAVVGYANEKWGERPKAYVLLRPDHRASEQELRDHARTSIAGYKVPDYVVFVDELPRTATGKVTKAVLRRLSDMPESATARTTT